MDWGRVRPKRLFEVLVLAKRIAAVEQQVEEAVGKIFLNGKMVEWGRNHLVKIVKCSL